MAIQEYRNEFRFHFPNEHRPAGRFARSTPLTAVLQGRGAAFMPINGWERTEYYKPKPDFTTALSFRFDEAFPIVAQEVKAVQSAVGMSEINGFTRIEITGRARHDFLDRLFCTALTRKEGRVQLGYMLTPSGMLCSEATLAHLAPSDRGGARVWYGSAAAAQIHDMEWLLAHRRPGEDVHFQDLTNAQTILLLAGPKARAVLSQVSRGDWSAAAFPWLSVRECFVGIAPATVMSVSYSGELAYEIHLPNASLLAAYHALYEAGQAHGLRLFGARAVESMRMEKGFAHWKSELITEYDPFEGGLSRFVCLKKDFIGKEAVLRRHARGATRQRVMLQLACSHAPAAEGASVMEGAQVVGTITSGAWGHRTSLNLAQAYVDPSHSAEGTSMAVDVLGETIPCQVVPLSPYDPSMRLPRG